jgi:mono/diheme cytochrome c family protein
MRRIAFRVLLWIGLGTAAASAALAGYVSLNWNRSYNSVPLPKLHSSTNPEVIRRGEYLVKGPAHCVECHATDTANERMAVDRDTVALSGGNAFSIGPLGTLYASNITPDRETGIGRYSDPQLARMLRHGVRPDGQASLPPLMPYGDMSDDDVIAVISYLRAQRPVRSVVPQNEWTLVGKVMRTFVSAAKPRVDVTPPTSAPPAAPTVARGAYIAQSVANCGGCHTAYNPLTGAPTVPAYSGGSAVEAFTPPNITPRPGSALMKFPDRDTFVARFMFGGRQYEGSPMPWEAFAKMAPEDIAALYEFLHAQAPAGDPSPRDPRINPSDDVDDLAIN